MSHAALAKVPVASAAEVCKRFHLNPEPLALLRDDLTPRQFLELLLDGQQFMPAIEFLAHALPKREAIWWGCLCARHVGGPSLPDPQKEALKASVQWALDPNEDHRRTAEKAAVTADMSTPAGCVATAVFWSGDSLNPPNLPAVPPVPYMANAAIAGAVQLASAQVEPEQILDVQRQFVELGIAIAEGQCVWPEKQSKP